jgi:hypothetical protein
MSSDSGSVRLTRREALGVLGLGAAVAVSPSIASGRERATVS